MQQQRSPPGAVEPPSIEPLTARIADAPSEHRGKGKFALRVAFSAPVAGRAKDAKIQVTGGTLTRAARVDERKDLWELRVRQAGYAAVTVTLPATADCAAAGAICTADGRRARDGADPHRAGAAGALGDGRQRQGRSRVPPWTSR